jgi:hypothetical protein
LAPFLSLAGHEKREGRLGRGTNQQVDPLRAADKLRLLGVTLFRARADDAAPEKADQGDADTHPHAAEHDLGAKTRAAH